MIRIETLGPVRVTVAGSPAPPELLWRKHLALLVYLARSPKRRRTRAHLVALLWPDKDESAARHSLNEALRAIRKAAPDGLDTDAEQAGLDEGVVRLDVDDLDRSAAAADWAGAANLVLGEFLEGFEIPGAAEFERWLTGERRRLGRVSTDALCHWSDVLDGQARIEEALAAAERALRIDPYSEPAIVRLMRALALLGNRSEAVARYDTFHALVGTELGVTPGKELAELATRLRSAPGGDPRASRGSRPTRADALRRAPLVGRASELGLLLASWHRSVGEPRAEVALVTGSQGFGRTRLLDEMAGRIDLAGGVVLRIRAVPTDQAGTWSGLLTLAAAGLAGAPGASAAPPEAIAALSGAVPQWTERFGSARLVGEPWSLARGFIEVVRSVSVDRPVALLVDDAHWLDDGSLGALDALVRSAATCPVWIGLSATTPTGRDQLDRMASQLGRDIPGLTLALGPLGADGIADLVRWAFPTYGPTEVERLARRIGTDSAGIPLLAVELVHAISNGMEPGAAAWPAPLTTLDQTLPGDLPPELVAAFRVSFRCLSPAGQSALSAAAVVGGRVSPTLLAAVADLPQEDTERALDELEWTRWLESEPRGYAFVARIAREVILQDMLTPGQRRRLETRLVTAQAPPA